jgi:hypothetical protein
MNFRTDVKQYKPVIPALGRLRQKDREFKDSLGCTVRPHLKKKKKKGIQ